MASNRPKRPGRTGKIALFSQEYRDLLRKTAAPELLVTSSRPASLYPPEEITGPKVLEEELPSTVVESGKRKDPSCLSCQVVFQGREEQVQHYQLDWHRYNLKRRLKGLSSVEQDLFEKTVGEECKGRER